MGDSHQKALGTAVLNAVLKGAGTCRLPQFTPLLLVLFFQSKDP